MIVTLEKGYNYLSSCCIRKPLFVMEKYYFKKQMI